MNLHIETNKFIFKPDCAFPSGPPHTLHNDAFLSDEFVDESTQKHQRQLLGQPHIMDIRFHYCPSLLYVVLNNSNTCFLLISFAIILLITDKHNILL